MTMRMTLLAASLLFAAGFASPAAAQQIEDVKINQLIVYGDEQCPRSTLDEITVCARKPESDRFRIPENLRQSPDSESWAVRAQSMEYVGASGIGSCSPTGPGGMIGCLQRLIDQAKAERENSDEVNWNRMIEQARQERLSQIDAEAESVQRQIDEREQP
jgi:hypothetical protein